MTRRSTDLLPPVQSPTAFADEKKEEEGGALPHLDSKGTITVEGEVRSLKRDLNSRQITYVLNLHLPSPPAYSRLRSLTLFPHSHRMISIAGTIGTGLFLGTGSALATGGPGSMVLSYSVIGGLVFVLMHCITGTPALPLPATSGILTQSSSRRVRYATPRRWRCVASFFSFPNHACSRTLPSPLSHLCLLISLPKATLRGTTASSTNPPPSYVLLPNSVFLPR